MKGNGERTLRVTDLDDALVRDYLIKLLNEGEDFVQDCTSSQPAGRARG